MDLKKKIEKEDSKQSYFISPPTAPPNIIEDNSPPSVICEIQTLCTFSCHATSGIPFNYSWTKNGQVPVGDDIKIRNNIIFLTPRDAEDYGVYVCHVTNSFGSKAYNITVLEGHKSADTIKGGGSEETGRFAPIQSRFAPT